MSCGLRAAAIWSLFEVEPVAEKRNSWHWFQEPIRSAVTLFVVAVAGCTVQSELVQAVAQSQRATNAVEQTGRETPKPSEADGERSPALTGERRPLYRLQKSDVVELEFPFSPELNETVIVQPDGFIPLRSARTVYAEGQTRRQGRGNSPASLRGHFA